VNIKEGKSNKREKVIEGSGKMVLVFQNFWKETQEQRKRDDVFNSDNFNWLEESRCRCVLAIKY